LLELALLLARRGGDEADRQDATGESVRVQLLLEPKLGRDQVCDVRRREAPRARGQRLATRRDERREQVRHLRLYGILVVAGVPDQAEPATRSKHTPHLTHRLVTPKPMERLAADDGVHGVVLERN